MLSDFVTSQACWACSLPAEIREEMDSTRAQAEAQGSGVPGAAAVEKWLIVDHGYAPELIKRESISNHFRGKHHLKHA